MSDDEIPLHEQPLAELADYYGLPAIARCKRRACHRRRGCACGPVKSSNPLPDCMNWLDQDQRTRFANVAWLCATMIRGNYAPYRYDAAYREMEHDALEIGKCVVRRGTKEGRQFYNNLSAIRTPPMTPEERRAFIDEQKAILKRWKEENKRLGI